MRFGMLIDGEFVTETAAPRLGSTNPANLAATGSVPVATAVEVDRAVRAAARAQREWARRSVWERAAALRALAAAIRARGAEILQLEAADTGNTIGKLGAKGQISGEMDEDSIIEAIPEARRKLEAQLPEEMERV